jgi:dTDP-4-amino-4,6-dideoxygalactose transaminase
VGKDVKSSQQYLVIRINEEQFGCSRDKVYERLKEYNVFSRKYFYPLCSNYDCYNDFDSAKKNKLSVANQVVDEVLSLPFYGALSHNEITKICNIINGEI